MAENVVTNPGTGGDTIAADDIAGVKYQRIKLALGADGVNDGDVSSSNKLPVNTGLTQPTTPADTQPISAVALPLPSGAATSALQTQPGVDIGDVTINNSSGASAVNIQDGGNSITVDGTVTANLGAGTNNIGDVDVLTVNGVAPAFGSGVRGATVQRVTIATDDAVPVTDNGGSLTIDYATTGNGTAAGAIRVALPTDGTGVVGLNTGSNVIGSLTANQSVNVAQVNGVTPLMGNGVTGTGSNRVTLASDGTAISTTGYMSVKLDQTTVGTTNAVSVAQIGANTVVAGNGVTGTGSQRVTIANDNTGIANWGQGATGAAVPSGAQYKGVLAQTALPTAATAGNLTGALADKFGRQVVLPFGMRDIMGSQTTTITASTTETTIITAAASTFNDVFAITASNTSATAVRLDFRDTTAGTVIFQLYVPAGDVRGISWTSPIPHTTVNSNWTATCSASVTDVRISAWFFKNK